MVLPLVAVVAFGGRPAFLPVGERLGQGVVLVRVCKSGRGLTQHQQTVHREFTPASEDDPDDPLFTSQAHPLLNGPPEENPPANSWTPFESRTEFDFAYYHFVEVQSSAANIDKALDMWAATIMEFGGDAPWTNSDDLYETIDAIQHGDAPWKMYHVQYRGPQPPGTPPKWMSETYELCARDSRQVLHHQLATEQFKDKINLIPYLWSNLMSADWAWSQADEIAGDVSNHGAMFVPIVAGSDKTTVSVATGHQEYHPVYMSPGNLTNIARHSHGNTLLPVAFLPIPKTSKKHRQTAQFQTFCRQMYHASLARVFEPLKDGMTTPEVVKCPDGHFRRAIYGLGPYIADYPEQVWLAGIVQGWCPKCTARPENLDAPGARRRTQTTTDFLISTWDPGILWTDFGVRTDILPFTHGFPCADIHDLLTPNLLHQVIKGAFKDHFIMWVNEYLYEEYGQARAHAIIEDIDCRISAVPPFPGLRRFPDGHGFIQWTGDDSKALMKVYFAAIAGHVPSEMVKCLSALLDFCYIARRNALTSDDLDELQDALTRFHHHRKVFIGTAGVNGDQISLPRQHALMHYLRSIRLFGSPNGLCSSITESKHIKAVKEPWRCSSRYNALKQMLVTIARLDKLALARRVFYQLRMMEGTTSLYSAMIRWGELPQPKALADGNRSDDDDDNDVGPVHGPKSLSSIELARTAERGYPRAIEDLAVHIGQLRFPELVRRFLYDQLNLNSNIPSTEVDLEDCPHFGGSVYVYHSAIARFYALSDLCGAGEYARHDTMFVETNADLDGMQGMAIGHALLFFSFTFRDCYYPCALVHWLVPGDEPDKDTGLWVVQPEFGANGRHTLAVIHLDCVARGAHLLPVYGSSFIPEDFHFSDALDAFRAYFVNRHIDHHSHDFIK
ncbi:hypothetical protein BJV74DRAFT_876020 [Russula compacta]|nr:hypothetical protein BJV74DRAFT_876020 [Russula compacta]